MNFPFSAGERTSTAVLYPVPPGPRSGGAVFVMAHGAGSDQRHPWIVAMAQALAARGMPTVTFDFFYRHAGRRLPDKNDVLEAAWVAVLGAVRARTEIGAGPTFIGGKSMGGRIATQIAAKGDAGDLGGIVLFGYPLHPPGRSTQLRSGHLASVRAPMLFVQGSRDAFGGPNELRPVIEAIGPRARLMPVEGADHSLAPSKRKGATLAGVIDPLADAVAAFTAKSI